MSIFKLGAAIVAALTPALAPKSMVWLLVRAWPRVLELLAPSLWAAVVPTAVLVFWEPPQLTPSVVPLVVLVPPLLLKERRPEKKKKKLLPKTEIHPGKREEFEEERSEEGPASTVHRTVFLQRRDAI